MEDEEGAPEVEGTFGEEVEEEGVFPDDADFDPPDESEGVREGEVGWDASLRFSFFSGQRYGELFGGGGSKLEAGEESLDSSEMFFGKAAGAIVSSEEGADFDFGDESDRGVEVDFDVTEASGWGAFFGAFSSSWPPESTISHEATTACHMAKFLHLAIDSQVKNVVRPTNGRPVFLSQTLTDHGIINLTPNKPEFCCRSSLETR